MKITVICVSLILCCFVRDFSAHRDYSQLLNIEYYKIRDCSVPLENVVPNFLVTCAYFKSTLFDVYVPKCTKNMSTPYYYELKCSNSTGIGADVHSFGSCNEKTCHYFEECNGSFYDPGTVIYSPLYAGDQKFRLYPEIFAEIRNITKELARAYINVLRQVFKRPQRTVG